MSSLREPLLPTRQPKVLSAAKETRLVVTAGAFLCFVAVRSFHPIVIDISKTDGKLPYGKATPCVVNSAVDVVLGNLLALLFGGTAGLKRCWDPATLKTFSAIAVLYAFGDFLEMVSMSVMGGAVYQILLQSKLLITALIVWALRGQRQTPLQWNVLVTIVMGMSAFVLVDENPSQAPFRPIGLLFVVAKVFFSCLCAVLTEKYLKAYKDMPIYMQVAQLKFAWLWVTLALTWAFDGNVRANGLFDGWDGRTMVVATSWVCKGWTTFLVLKNLDSVLKNIGEAVAILVIYLFDVVVADKVADLLPVQGKEFRLSVFLMVLVVVLTVVTYTMAAPQKPPGTAKSA
uniref:Sugar phosphate transporter domain-containing protein n=1 Tax=Pyrodinium bahamense TaxID=73915 RepID=A0A7S0FA42_9DINO|mmetsp:Transcript_15262/g.42153  ORF Transcript_15262/g.42153 Transcript_15262/m.42153 type:complete len:344 (+) Transcript_15262:44-1075(+)